MNTPIQKPQTAQEMTAFVELLNSLPTHADRAEMLAACGYRSLPIFLSPTPPPSK